MLLIFCGFFSLVAVNAQDILPSHPAQAADNMVFPDDYIGNWTGELNIYTAEGLRQSIPMELGIQPINDSTFTYALVYGADKETGLRDYLLRKGDQGANHWVIDEQDGILLDNFYVGGILHGPFSVMGSMLYSKLERRGAQLHYSISSGSQSSFRKSGTTTETQGEQEQITVESFKTANYQVAILTKRD